MSNVQSVVGYVRCSTQEQGETGLSIDAQCARIEAWCRASGSRLAEVVEDRGVSGTKQLAERPGGSRIADLLNQRNPSVSTIVVVRLDRLGRDAAETLSLFKRFKGGKLGLVSITDRLDLATPQGRAMAGVAAVFAELERNLIGERTADALDRLRCEGRVYGPAPFGFDARDGLLVRNETEQATMTQMSDLRDAGHSYAVIASRLNEQGLPSKRGGRWHSMSVRSVLKTQERLRPLTGAGPVSDLAVQPS